MEQELNIAAILRDKPKGTMLYDTVRRVGVTYQWVDINNKTIHGFAENKYLIYECNGSLIGYPKGAQILKPSNGMQNWSKFAWKKGDVLVDNKGYTCLFCKWKDDTYTSFIGKYTHFEDLHNRSIKLSTDNFHKIISNEKIDEIIKEVEAYYNGKLNLETLEIERPKPQFKDGDIVSVIDCYSNIQICIVKSINKNRLEYYASSSHIVEDWLNTDGKTVCLSLDSEKQQLFDAIAKEGKRWNAETKTLEDLPKKCELKPFDKVLVRDSEEKRWDIDLFKIYRRGEYPYVCLTDEWEFCIPYNEQTKHLLGTTDDYKIEL